MLEKLALLYPGVDEERLQCLLDAAQAFVLDYCNLDEYDTALDAVVLRVVQEDVTKMDSHGLASESAGGVSASYTDDYAPAVYRALNKHKRVRTLG